MIHTNEKVFITDFLKLKSSFGEKMMTLLVQIKHLGLVNSRSEEKVDHRFFKDVEEVLSKVLKVIRVKRLCHSSEQALGYLILVKNSETPETRAIASRLSIPLEILQQCVQKDRRSYLHALSR